MDEDTDEHLGPEERSLRDAFVRSITDMLDAEPYLRTYKTSAFPLLLFVWLRSIEGVERMLELGFYADANEDIWTGLYFACLKGHDRIVSLLLQRGAEPSRKSRRGTNALMVAAEGGHVRTVDLLLQHKGQDVDERDRHGRTALWLACSEGHAAVARLLLVKGQADWKEGDAEGDTPEDIARSKGHLLCVQAIKGFEQEMERSYLLVRARAMVDDKESISKAPEKARASCERAAQAARESMAPVHLKGRVERRQPLSTAEVRVVRRSKRKAGEDAVVQDELRRAVLGFCIGGLNADLFEELRQMVHPR